MDWYTQVEWQLRQESGLEPEQGVDWDYDSDGSHIAYTNKARRFRRKPMVVTFEEMLHRRLVRKEQEDSFLTPDISDLV